MKVSRNGICGTDLHEYYDGPIFIPPSDPHPLTHQAMPVVLGHEFSGVVTDVGRGGVTGISEGDKVAIEPLYRAVIDLMSGGHYDVTGWVETIPLSRVLEDGFEDLRAGRKMKLLVDPTA